MTESDLLKLRLNNHLITQGKLNAPESVVSWMGAIQAQDYGQAKYAIGSRMVSAGNSDIEQAIQDKKIVRTTTGLRGTYLLYKAGWLGIICLGIMRDKQDTYTLLQEWLTKPGTITREEALAKLTERYFQSHGPATLKDYALWSGLSITEARAGFELIRETLIKVEMNGQLYWMIGNNSGAHTSAVNHYFLAGFDEYLLGYKDRSIILDSANTKKVILQNGIFKPIIIENGKVIGTWNRSINKNKIDIVIYLFDGAAQKSDLNSPSTYYPFHWRP